MRSKSRSPRAFSPCATSSACGVGCQGHERLMQRSQEASICGGAVLSTRGRSCACKSDQSVACCHARRQKDCTQLPTYPAPHTHLHPAACLRLRIILSATCRHVSCCLLLCLQQGHTASLSGRPGCMDKQAASEGMIRCQVCPCLPCLRRQPAPPRRHRIADQSGPRPACQPVPHLADRTAHATEEKEKNPKHGPRQPWKADSSHTWRSSASCCCSCCRSCAMRAPCRR